MMLPFSELVSKYKLNITGVVHIGANEGQEKDLYNQYVNGEVLWFEAIDFVFDKLKENIKPYPKQTAIKACLSNVDGKTVAFNISNNEAQSSSMLNYEIHSTIHPEVHFIDCVPMVTKRFDTLINLLERDISKCNLLNIDTEGAELLIMEGMGKHINQFDYIISELHLNHTYENCPLVHEIDEFLSDFVRVETGAWVAGSWSDGLYIKRSLQ